MASQKHASRNMATLIISETMPLMLQGPSASIQGMGKQLYNGGSPYNPSELSGWGSNLNNAYPNPNLDTAALLSAQVRQLNLGRSWVSSC